MQHSEKMPFFTHPLMIFDEVRIINLAERVDRRTEAIRQLNRLGRILPNTSFFEAKRPSSAGSFPSIGARGCFESHLAVLKAARDRHCRCLLLLEDDLDFTRDGLTRMEPVLAQLSVEDWSFFYGAHVLPARNRRGLVQILPDEPVLTASFVAFKGDVIVKLVEFLEAMLKRPAGSPDYGPMHVDGAYTVFRKLNPHFATLVAFPPIGKQRSSRSDITPTGMILDRFHVTQRLAAFLRRSYNRLGS